MELCNEALDGTPIKRLHRIERNVDDPNNYRLCLSQLHIFDVIDEIHRANGHFGQERTYTALADKYYNVTQALVKIYCSTCLHCNASQPVIAPQKGAKKPILSHEFRDRFQVDLVDMRKKKRRNIYGVMQRWLMTVKDHSTGLTFVASIPRKRPKYVAHELDRLFGLIGYPSIFHTDNGKEFTGKELIDILKQISPSIVTVTGRPRTPRDQGSVESMNKVIKRVLGSIESEERQLGREPNWTSLLGRIMAAVNNQRSRGADSVTAYKAVFGQDYHQQFACTMEQARQCNTIEQRLKLSSDSRLERVAKECCYIADEESEHHNTNNNKDDEEGGRDGYWSDESAPLNSDDEEDSSPDMTPAKGSSKEPPKDRSENDDKVSNVNPDSHRTLINDDCCSP